MDKSFTCAVWARHSNPKDGSFGICTSWRFLCSSLLGSILSWLARKQVTTQNRIDRSRQVAMCRAPPGLGQNRAEASLLGDSRCFQRLPDRTAGLRALFRGNHINIRCKILIQGSKQGGFQISCLVESLCLCGLLCPILLV